MKYISKHCCWLVLLLLVIGLQISYASGSFPSPVKKILLEPISDLTTDNPVRFSVTFVPKEGFGDKLTFQIAGTNGLTTVGPDTRILSYNDEGNFETEFEIMIPKNDTSRLTVQILKKSIGSLQARFFVTTADTVEYYRAHPLDVARQPKPQTKGFPLFNKIKTHSPDSTYRFSLEPAPPLKERQLAEMRQLEEEPLIGAQLQYHTVDGKLYRRLEGEIEFTLVKRLSAEESRAKKQAYVDSLAGLPANTEVQVCLNLRGHHLEFVKEMIGPVGTPESESYYHLTVTRELLDQLREKGIPIMYLDFEDVVHRPHPSELPSQEGNIN